MKNLTILIGLLVCTIPVKSQTIWNTFTTSYGYIQLGPANPGWGHIYTDRPAFIFNKPVYSYGGQFCAYSTYDMQLQTNGQTRVTINGSNGNVGIGTTNVSEKLTVNGNIGITDGGLNINSADPFLDIVDNNCDDCGGGRTWHKMLLTPGYGLGVNIVGSPSDLPYNVSTNSALYTMGYISTYTDYGGGTINYSTLEPDRILTSSNTNYFGFFKDDGNYQSIIAADGMFDGKVTAKSIEVKLNIWADDVFNHDYKLMSLADLDKFIQANKHLPGVPTETEVKQNGVDLGNMNTLLLRKVEELTRYVIELRNEIDQLKTENQK